MRLCFLLGVFVISVGIHAQRHNKSWSALANTKDTIWLESDEAKVVAENVLLYQRDIGGWPKNIQMQQLLSESEKNVLIVLKSDPIGATTDNDATIQELGFLSKIYSVQPDERYKKAFLLGVEYILKAQYENGGWPQFYPLREGYYSRITYNDNSMVNILNFLKEIKDKTQYYSIKPSEGLVEKADRAFQKGIECILKTQYLQNGVLTAWCAQHDEVTLEPAKARSYELPSLSGGESAGIVDLLMRIENPSPEIIQSVEAAVSWFEKAKLSGIRQKIIYNDEGKRIEKIIVTDADAPALWARFMDLDDNAPIFSDRDGVIKKTITEIGHERRNGYGWYVEYPQQMLDRYAVWKSKIKEFATDLNPENYKVVAQDGTGDYKTIQEAINSSKSFPYERITIYVKNGTYKEKIKVHEWNTKISLIGESKEHTIITYDDYFKKMGLGRNSTFYTYTLLVEGDDFIAKNLTIENSSGEVGQAVALSVISDRVAIINCNLLGHQDTLYASGTGKQYYKDCYIEGTTDFIFGNATAYFENCELRSKKDSYITAASTPEDSAYGYVFEKCRLTAEAGVSKVYLGRPWRVHAKTVFIDCELGDHILPEGWHNWSKPEAEQTTFYAEFQNRGIGFKPKKRVSWSHQLKSSEVNKFTLKSILGEHTKTSKKQWYENL